MIGIVSTCAEPLHEKEFVDPIERFVQQHAPTKRLHIATIDLPDLKDITALIICGTALTDNDYVNHVHRLDFIPTSSAPVLGICSGMHLLSLLYDGSLFTCKQIGMVDITVTAPDHLLFSNIKTIYALHNTACTTPETFTTVAHTAECDQIIAHKEKPHYGVLFHPEVRSTQILLAFLQHHADIV